MRNRDSVLWLLLLICACTADALVPVHAHVLTGFWAAAIPAIISAVGGYFTSKSAKKKTAQEKMLMDQQLQTGQFLNPYGQKMLGKAEQASELPFAHYSTMAGGNRHEALAGAQPELMAFDQSQRAGLGAMAEQGQRGGAQGDVLSRLPFQRAQNTAMELGKQRAQAFTGLAGMSGQFGQLGLNALTGGQAGNMNLLNYGLNRDQHTFDQASQAGSGLYNIARDFMSAYGQRSQTGSTNNNPFGTQTMTPANTGSPYGYGPKW